jgi:hypothetical protein
MPFSVWSSGNVTPSYNSAPMRNSNLQNEISLYELSPETQLFLRAETGLMYICCISVLKGCGILEFKPAESGPSYTTSISVIWSVLGAMLYGLGPLY